MSLHLLQGCSNFDLNENYMHSFFPLYSPTIPLLQIERFGNHVQFCHSGRYTNADLRIYKYLRLHMKMIENVENFTLKYLLLFEIYARKVCEKLVYKHSETIEYVKN